MLSLENFGAGCSVPDLGELRQGPSKNDYQDPDVKKNAPKANVGVLAIRGCGKDNKVPVKLASSIVVEKEVSKTAELEQIYNIWGSSAGSGSDAFPLYRRHRNRELERLAKMDEDYDNMQAAESFQAKRELAETKDDAATEAKRAKRQKRKDSKQAAKTDEKTKKEAVTLNKFTADGSWFEQMKKVSAAEMEQVAKEAEELKEKAKAEKKAAASNPQISVKQMSSAQNIIIRDLEI